MTDRHAMRAENDRSMDINFISRIFRQHKRWIAFGTVLGIVLSLAYLFLAPTKYTATARVSITALGSEPVPEDRALSSLVDVPTERQLASSVLTTEGAARNLGEGWSAPELRDGLTVSGDSSSTVLGLSYSATDRDRAIQGADALATAYLEVRAGLVMERAKDMAEKTDQRIAEYEAELRELIAAGGEDDLAASVRADSIEAGILALQQRRANWSDLDTQAGQVISPARSSEVNVSPVLWRVLLLGLLGGVFLGFVLAAIRYALSRVASHAEDVEELLDVRLLHPQAPVRDLKRWNAAAILAHHEHKERTPLLLLVDENYADARAAADAFTAQGPTTRINLHLDRAELLERLEGVRNAVLIVSPTWKRADLVELVDDLHSMGIHLIGAAVTTEHDRKSAAARG